MSMLTCDTQPDGTGGGCISRETRYDRCWLGVEVSALKLDFEGELVWRALSSSRTVVSVVIAEVGGWWEVREDGKEPVGATCRSTHRMSLIPAQSRMWEYGHHIRQLKELRLCFDDSSLPRVLGPHGAGHDFNSARLNFVNGPAWKLAELLYEELSTNSNSRAIYGESLVVALLASLLRPSEHDPAPGLAPWQLRRVTEYMDGHANAKLSDLANIVGLSVAQFARAFKASTGESPHLWHLASRVRRAEKLLLEGRMSVADVALATGFSEQSHFTRVFRRFIGAPPSAWKREHDVRER
jgi:AraC-like DNA-binding protein